MARNPSTAPVRELCLCPSHRFACCEVDVVLSGVDKAFLIQDRRSSPGSMSTRADRRKRPTTAWGSEYSKFSKRSAFAAAAKSRQPAEASGGSASSDPVHRATASASPYRSSRSFKFAI